MKALSIQQPWAHYIMRFGKPVENRTWYTSIRGKIVVHAGKRWDVTPEKDGLHYGVGGLGFRLPILPATDFTLGAFLGVVTIVDCVKGFDSPWADPDQWQFVLRDPIPFARPIPGRGSLGFFDVPEAVLTQARNEWRQRPEVAG